MTAPATAREALIVEAIGDVAQLLRDVEALAPTLEAICQTLQQSSIHLRDDLADFERRLAAITENAKAQTVKHMAVRADEATRRVIGQQGQAMADAARVAFGAELGATMQRLQAMLQPLTHRRERTVERWLTHMAAAVSAAAATWALALYVGPH